MSEIRPPFDLVLTGAEIRDPLAASIAAPISRSSATGSPPLAAASSHRLVG